MICQACLPLTPIAFNNLFLWNCKYPIHTLVIGCARAEDFDEHVQSALMYEKKAELVAPVESKLKAMVATTFDDAFLDNW
jgi:uncharacterized protein